MRVCKTLNPSCRGAQLLEAAVVIPIVLMLTLGTCVLAMGIHYYQLVATLAREGARYASVHGAQYAAFTGNPAATPASIYTNAILPMAVGLNSSDLTYSVTWPTGNSPYNPVSVTVSYQWTPGLYITGSINLTSTSVMPVSF